jgi:hypothetical protein
MRCTNCGHLGADVRPNWKERHDLPGDAPVSPDSLAVRLVAVAPCAGGFSFGAVYLISLNLTILFLVDGQISHRRRRGINGPFDCTGRSGCSSALPSRMSLASRMTSKQDNSST